MIRATKIEIWKFCEGNHTRREKWMRIAEQVQRMQNRMWQLWLVHHVQNDSADKVRKHLDNFKKWNVADKKTRGPKPKWPVQAIDKEISKIIYDAIAAEFSDVHGRTRELVRNKWKQTLNKRKAARGKLPGWVAILFANESLPSTTKPQPIPFDNGNFLKGGGLTRGRFNEYKLDCCIERGEDGASFRDVAELMMNRRGMYSIRVILDRVMSGEYTFKGSSLVYKKGKWFASICYEQPTFKHPRLDPGRTLQLIPGKTSPWIVVKSNGPFRYGGRGRHIVHVRRLIQDERWGRQEGNRWGSSSTKGRGRKRAEAAWTKLTNRWVDFRCTNNDKLTKKIIAMAVESGIGRIVYHQPMDSNRDKTFLASRGRHPKSSMTWDWHQVGSQLKAKAEEFGIQVDVVKH